MKSIKKLTILLPLIVMCLMIVGVSPVSAASSEFLSSSSDAGITVTGSTGYNLNSAGTIREGEVTLRKSNGSSVGAHVVLVKANAKAKFKPVIPNYYTSGSYKSQRVARSASWSNWGLTGVTNMVRQYQSAADTNKTVYAAINGDFGMGSKPRGSVIMEGGSEINAASAYEDEFFFGHKSTTGTLNILQRTSSQKSTFDEALCGGAHILRNGALFGVDGETASRQRTAIGIKSNGDTLLVCVESGVTVKQLAQLLRDSGCWNAINMDGGGSITMVTKRTTDGDTVRRTPLSGYSDVDGNKERLICSALMLVADDTVVNNVGTVSGNSITTDKTTYNVGDDIYVTASSASDGSWVSILKADDSADTGEYFWYYTYGNSGSTWCWENGTKNNIYAEGMCSQREGVTADTKLPPGRYRAAILNYNSSGTGYQELASRYFTIKSDDSTPYTLTTDKSVYNIGDPIMVTATRPSADSSAWVAIVKHGRNVFDGDGGASYFWDYVPSDGSAFNLLEPENIVGEEDYGEFSSDEQALIDRTNNRLNAGKYDIIMLTYDSYSVAENNGQKVIKTIDVIGADEEYSITYKDGNYNLSSLSPTTYKLSAAQSGAISLPTNVSKPGYNFVGWYTDASFSGNAVTSIPKGSNGNKVFYAKFEKKTYTVTFQGANGAWAEQQVKYGEYASAPTGTPTKEHYNFAKWVTSAGGNTSFAFGSTPITSDITVYASWTPVTYKISFDSNGGTAVSGIEYNIETPAFNLPTPTKEGNNFMNWKNEATGQTYTQIPKGTYGNMTLVAQWRNSKVFSMEKVDYVYGEDIIITTYFDEPGGWVGLYFLGEDTETTTPILKFEVPVAGTQTDITDKARLDEYKNRPEAWYPVTEDCTGELKSGSYTICVFDGNNTLKDAAIITIDTKEYNRKVTAPTCTEDGYTTIFYTDGTTETIDKTKAFGHSSEAAMDCEVAFTCASCGASIAAREHVSSGEATCTESEVCTVCEKVMTSAPGHTWADATCTAPKTCTVCGDTSGKELGHDWDLATCTSPMECKNCHETEGEPLGHAWMNATCTEAKTCFICQTTEGDALGHEWNEGVVTKNPTCTKDGVRLFTCTVCESAQKEEAEPKTDHSYKTSTVAPTCTMEGVEKKECINRDCNFVEIKKIPAAHTPGPEPTCMTPQKCKKCPAILQGTIDHEPGAEPTCTEMQKCKNCPAILKSALGHKPGDGPTCTEDLVCEREGCGIVLVEATGHTKGKAATCTTAQTCTDCDYLYQAAFGHTEGEAATCTTAQICTVCKVVVTEALGHKAGPEPTCTESQDCQVCHTVLKAANGHKKMILPGVAATCTSTGVTEGEACEACGEVLTSQSVVPKLAHTAADEKVVAATKNADGKVTHLCACGMELSTERIYSIASVKLSATTMAYNGKVKNPTVTVEDNKGNVISEEHYEVVVPAGRKSVGKYTYKVTFKGNYAGEETLKMTIKPAKPTILAPKAAKKAVTVKWKKVAAQADGYQIMTATNKKFTKNTKKVFVKGSKNTYKKVSKLKTRTTYFVKVRTYKTVKGVKIYSAWSKVKTIKTK